MRSATAPSSESVKCESNQYLGGCTKNSAGNCFNCDTAHGAGCVKCSATECEQWGCAKRNIGTCAGDEYLLGCVDATAAAGFCTSCAASSNITSYPGYGLGCTKCSLQENGGCETRDCTTSGANTCNFDEYLFNCGGGNVGACVSCS